MSEIEIAARFIWNAFNARQGGTFEGAKGTLAYDHCISTASRILTASTAREAALREALEKASGYMTNAAIDLQTGAPKRTALNTIEGGLKMVRAALDQGTPS